MLRKFCVDSVSTMFITTWAFQHSCAKVPQMPLAFLNRLVLMLLVIAMTSNSLWNLAGIALAHDLDHLGKMSLAAVDHNHTAIGATVSDEDTDEVNSPLIHHMLHATDHQQLFPHAFARTVFAPTVQVLVLPRLMAIYLPMMALAPPFRPPRPDALFA